MANDTNEFVESYEIPENMTVYYLGLLQRGPNWTPEVERLQQAHLANIRRMSELGKLIIAGPLLDHGFLRGIYIFRVRSLEEARALVATDPSVQAGRLAFELHPWMVLKGVLPE